MKLKDQVAIVTGAGRNIGEEIATLLAAEGARVAVVDMDRRRGERVANAIRQGRRPSDAVRRRRGRGVAMLRRWSKTVVAR